MQLVVILNKRFLRSDEPVPSLPRESGRAADASRFFADAIIARLARFPFKLHHYLNFRSMDFASGLCHTRFVAKPSRTVRSAMRSSWQTETAHPVCRWSEVGQRVRYHAPWMRDAPESGYVPPVTDFAATVHLGEPLGSCSMPLAATPNRICEFTLTD